MSKNDTLLSTLLGTWTGQIHINSQFQFTGFFVLYIMPDPMRKYSCSLEKCNEIDNQVCSGPVVNVLDEMNRCAEMADEVIDWSDFSVFLNIGGKFNFGAGLTWDNSLGGWSGPYNMILAQAKEGGSKTINGLKVIDRYVAKYVATPSTRYIRLPNNDSDFFPTEEDFERCLGRKSVKNTLNAQASDLFNDPKNDPYAKFKGTCRHGDVLPILPIFEFTFLEDVNAEDEISVHLKVDYKLPILTYRSNAIGSAMDYIAQLGIPISGPYCYRDRIKGAYSLDISYTSTKASEVNFDHGCIEGLPCIPSAARFGEHDALFVGQKLDDDHALMYLVYGFIFISTVLIFSTALNCRQRMYIRRIETEVIIHSNYLELEIDETLF